jgi:hypothetical protein
MKSAEIRAISWFLKLSIIFFQKKTRIKFGELLKMCGIFLQTGTIGWDDQLSI